MESDKLEDITNKLLEINKIITKLDPEIRGAAFEFLAPLFFGKTSKSNNNGTTYTGDSPTNKEGFYNKYEHEKPRDNVFLIVAWLFSQHGVFPITRSMITEEASEAGLTIPERPDNTMRGAKHNGKNLFRQRDNGWQLTVSGEAYIKEEYEVKKGNKPFLNE